MKGGRVGQWASFLGWSCAFWTGLACAVCTSHLLCSLLATEPLLLLLPCHPAADAAADVVADSQQQHGAGEVRAGSPSPQRHQPQQAAQPLDPSVRLYLEAVAEQLIATHTTEVRWWQWRWRW